MKKLLKQMLAMVLSLALVLGGVGVIPAATTEASSTGYTELTFSDFGITDGQSFVNYASFTVQDSNITTLEGTAFTGKVTMTALDQWLELGGGATAFGVHSSGPTAMFRDFQYGNKYEIGTGAKDTEYLIRITFDAVDGGTEINCYLNDIEGEPVATYTVANKDTLVPRLGLAYATVTSVYVGQEEMSVDSVHSFSTDSGDWRFYFNMNGTWPTTGAFEEYTNTSVTVTIKNASGEILATAEGSPLQNYKNGPYWMLCVWGVHTGNNAPAEGDTITISSGQLANATDATKIVNFAEETVLEYDGANWSVYEEPIEYTYTDISLVWGDYPSNKPNTDGGYWDLYVDTSEVLPGTAWSTVYSDIKVMSGETELAASVKKAADKRLNIFIPGSELSVESAAGTTITIKAGQSLGSDLETEGINITEDFTMVLGEDGTLSEYIEYTYTDISLIWGDYPSNKPDTENNFWDLYVGTSAVLPGTKDTTLFKDIKVMTGDTEIPATVKKAGDNLLSIFIMDETKLPVTSPAGTKITIKAGQSLGSDLATEGINITEDFTMVLGEDGKLSEYIEYTYTDITIAGIETVTISEDGNGNPYWDIYLDVEGTLPGTNWQTKYDEVVLMVDDTEIEGVVKRANRETQLNLFIWGTEMSTTPEVGTRFTLKAGQSLGYNVSDGVSIGSGINITTDYVVEWNGSEWGAPTEWTNVAINGLNINTAVSGEKWQAYFSTDAVLPGEAWGVVNNKQESYTFDAEINGVATTLKVRKSADRQLYVEIPTAKLPENAEATVTFKAGKYQSNVQSIGYNLTEDFVFYTNAYGWTTVADAVVSDVTFTLDATSASGKSANGFILNTNIDDGVTPDLDNWKSRVYAAHEKGVTEDKQTLYFAGENGVFKNGVYQAVDLSMAKLYPQTYYVAIGDAGLSASTGDYYTISGVFIDRTTGKFIEFEPITVKWNGEVWEKIATILGDKGVLHDVNADGELDVKDLVRMKRYLADAATAINAAQKDINFSGATDNADATSLRKVLIGLIRYDAEGLVYEVPVYDDDLIIERMAYSSPAVGTLNSDGSFASQLSDAEIDAVFQEYKAAGFTLLNSEHVAAYKDRPFADTPNEPLRVYLEAAERNGLGVIVYSDYLNAALKSDDLANGVYNDWQAIVDHMISNMSGYESFRGFMMSDELYITYASNYQTIATYLTENYPELLLHSSQLPVTAYSGLGADTLTLDTTTNSTEELAYRDYIWNFAQASGTYTYDLYPLVYSADKIFGITVKSEHGVNDDWYRNLQYVADEVKEHNYSFTTGITLQSCMLEGTGSIWSEHERYAPTLKADIGFQVYTAMAYGMQEFNFFTYEDHFSDPIVSNAMADNAEVYAAVQAVNTEVDKFAHVFKAFSWKDTLDIADGSSASTTLSSRLASASVTGARVFVGCMKDDDGFDGYMVANADGPRTAGTATVTLTFNSAVEAVVYTNGEPQRVTLTDGVCTVTVGAGEGVFVIPIAGVTSTDAADYCDFIVDVESGAEPVVLQITDTQIIYAEGERTEDRLSEVGDTYWAKANKDARCYSYLKELVTATNPDLILVTGDLVYGEFDDTGEAFTDFVTYMEGLKIPWAPVFGNHEAETKVTTDTASGIDVYCDQLEAAEYCLFKQRELTGNGNYTVGIRQDGELKRVFFMLDSNGCGAASEASLANGHTVRTVGFAKDQIEWYTETAKTITGYSRNTKLSFAFHIQLQAFADAYAKYGYTNDDTSINNPIHIDLLADKAEGDFGYLGRKLKDGWDTEYVVWNGLKELGVDSIFVGHEHCNSASVVYEGIRCQYGQKSSTYDRANFVNTSTGVITGDACLDRDSNYVPLIGGTVLPLSSDGSFNNPYIYLCENAGGTIDWDAFKEPESAIKVEGLQYESDFTADSAITVEMATIADENAWKVDSPEQSKVYISDLSLVTGKTKFTFSVYVPEESTFYMDLDTKPQFAIRVKPNENEPTSDGNVNGYIEYSTKADNDNYKLVYGQWQTFTVDISGISTCTQFAFNIAAGNVIYLKDIAFE